MSGMNQLGQITGAAKQVGTVAHEHVTGLALSPIPTLIVLAIVVMFGLVGLIVRGGQRPARGAHRA